MYVEVSFHNRKENSVLIKNNVLIAYDGGHPNLENAIRESESKALKKITSPLLPQTVTKNDFIKNFSDQNSGKPFRLIIGEFHSDHVSWEIVLQAIRHNSIKTLFIEHLIHQIQPELDAWQKTSVGTPLPSEIETIITPKPGAPNYIPLKEVLETAKAHGVRVVGIDSESLFQDPTSLDELKRVREINYYASQIINDAIKPEDSFIAIVGANHSTDVRKSVGLDRLCGATSVIIAPSSYNDCFTDPRITMDDKIWHPHVVLSRTESPDIPDLITVQIKISSYLKNKIKSSWNTVQNVFIVADTPKTSSTHTPIPEDFSLKKHNTSGKVLLSAEV